MSVGMPGGPCWGHGHVPWQAKATPLLRRPPPHTGHCLRGGPWVWCHCCKHLLFCLCTFPLRVGALGWLDRDRKVGRGESTWCLQLPGGLMDPAPPSLGSHRGVRPREGGSWELGAAETDKRSIRCPLSARSNLVTETEERASLLFHRRGRPDYSITDGRAKELNTLCEYILLSHTGPHSKQTFPSVTPGEKGAWWGAAEVCSTQALKNDSNLTLQGVYSSNGVVHTSCRRRGWCDVRRLDQGTVRPYQMW